MIAYPVIGKKKSRDICEAFVQGAGKSDAAVFYGVDESNIEAWRTASDYFYIDNSYLDATRGTHFRVTRNALQHSGIGTSDGKRFDGLDIQISSWREIGEHIVICPQSESFMRDLIGYKGDWLTDTKAQLQQTTIRELRVRDWDRDKVKLAATLPDDLHNAWALVTHSSAAAVTAVLNGIPVVVTGQSAAGPMGGPLSCIGMLRKPERKNWAGVLADNQFTIEEMRDGTAWQRLVCV